MSHCISCKYFQVTTPVGTVVDVYGETAQETLGQCRCCCPVIATIPNDFGIDAPTTTWPEVSSSDWCGDYIPQPID